MSSIQRYLPIMEDNRNSVLGLVDLGVSIEFTGSETSQAMQNTPPGAATHLRIEKYSPTRSSIRKTPEWVMVARFTHLEVVNKAYQGVAKFIPNSAVESSTTWTSGSGKPNQIYEFVGLMDKGLSSRNGFQVGAVTPPSGLPEGFVVETPGTVSFGLERVGYPIRFVPTTYVDVDPNDGYVAVVLLRNGAAAPEVGNDGSTLEFVYAPYYVPEVDSQGQTLALVEVIFNEDFDSIIHVGTPIASAGAMAAEDPSQAPVPISVTPATLTADAGYWSLSVFNPSSFVSRGTGAVLTYEWYVNGVAKAQSSPFDSYTISTANLVANGVVDGDTVYIRYTCTDSQGATTIQSASLVATAGNLA